MRNENVEFSLWIPRIWFVACPGNNVDLWQLLYAKCENEIPKECNRTPLITNLFSEHDLTDIAIRRNLYCKASINQNCNSYAWYYFAQPTQSKRTHSGSYEGCSKKTFAALIQHAFRTALIQHAWCFGLNVNLEEQLIHTDTFLLIV